MLVGFIKTSFASVKLSQSVFFAGHRVKRRSFFFPKPPLKLICMYIYIHIFLHTYIIYINLVIQLAILVVFSFYSCIMYVCSMHVCNVCMYACMHVCMYACMYVCMYVCMYF